MGVPQESILPVTLFSIQINRLPKALSDNVGGSLFVDDFLICYRGRNMNINERQLQLCLNKVEKWAIENEFKSSRSKPVGIHFNSKGRLYPDRKLYNSPVKIVLENKCLCLLLILNFCYYPYFILNFCYYPYFILNFCYYPYFILNFCYYPYFILNLPFYLISKCFKISVIKH